MPFCSCCWLPYVKTSVDWTPRRTQETSLEILKPEFFLLHSEDHRWLGFLCIPKSIVYSSCISWSPSSYSWSHYRRPHLTALNKLQWIHLRSREEVLPNTLKFLAFLGEFKPPAGSSSWRRILFVDQHYQHHGWSERHCRRIKFFFNFQREIHHKHAWKQQHPNVEGSILFFDRQTSIIISWFFILVSYLSSSK